MVPVLMRAAMLALFLMSMFSTPTSAHAGLDRANPEPGARIDTPPDVIELWFTEELSDGSTATVTGPDDQRVDNNDAAIDLFDPDRKHLTLTLTEELPAGTYTVEWTTVSGEDGDTDTGSFTFTLTTPATPVASPIASPMASPSPDLASTRVLGQVQVTEEPAEPDVRALMIALGVGVVAAIGIYLFWRLVRPRK